MLSVSRNITQEDFKGPFGASSQTAIQKKARHGKEQVHLITSVLGEMRDTARMKYWIKGDLVMVKRDKQFQEMRLMYKVESVETNKHVVTKVTPQFLPHLRCGINAGKDIDVQSYRHGMPCGFEKSTTVDDKLDSGPKRSSGSFTEIRSGSWDLQQNEKNKATVNANTSPESSPRINSISRLPATPKHYLHDKKITKENLQSLDHTNENFLPENIDFWIKDVEKYYFQEKKEKNQMTEMLD